MTRTSNATILILSLMAFSACSSMKVYQSLPEPGGEEGYRLDEESQISYRVSNDRDSLHLQFRTSDMNTIMKVMRRGLAVNFDTTGKRKEKISFLYPLPPDQRMGRDQQAFNMGSQRRGSASGARMARGGDPVQRIRRMLRTLSNEASFTRNGETELLVFDLMESDIKASLELDQEGVFHYVLKLPFQLLSPGGLESLEKLSLGLVIDIPESSDGGPGMGPGGGMGRGSGMNPGDGRGTGGGRGGMQPGGQGAMGGPPPGMDRDSMNEPLNLWFRVELRR